MAVAFAGTTSSAASNSATSLVLSTPAGLADGELLFEAEMFRNTPADTVTAPPTPTGWTINAPTLNNNGQNAAYRKLIVTASGEPASYTFTTQQTANRCCALLARVSGADTSTPVDVTSATATSGLTAPAITTVTPGALLVMYAVTHVPSAVTLDLSVTGMTRIGQIQCGTTSVSALAVFAETRPTAGSTGTRTLVVAGGTPTSSTTWLTALRPAPGFGAPAGLAYVDVANAGNRDIQLSWGAVTGATSYQVERDGITIATVTSPAYTDASRSPTTFATYRVRAVQ